MKFPSSEILTDMRRMTALQGKTDAGSGQWQARAGLTSSDASTRAGDQSPLSMGRSMTGRSRPPTADLLKRADPLAPSGVHHHDPVGDGDRLLLAIGRNPEGRADVPPERLRDQAHPMPEPGIEHVNRVSSRPWSVP